jgi:spore germination protein YaaH
VNEPTDEISDEHAAVAEADAPPRTRRRLVTLAALGAALVAVVVGVTIAADREPPPPPDLPVDAWAPYWALEASVADLPAIAGSLRELSPFWFRATGADTIEVDPNTPVTLADELVRRAREAGVGIVPAIVDAMPAGGMAAVLADPVTRSRHVDAIVAFAERGSYDGIDIDYEQFAFADGRDTWADTRPNWVAFVTELAERLHADGRTLTVSIPPVYDDGRTEASGYWVYDYGAIAPVVDRIRVMAYDFSTATAGPIAPLPWVERVVEGTKEASGAPEKLVLGLPMYGYNWAAGDTGGCPESETVGRTAVTIRNVGDLITMRDATPVYDETTAEWAFVYDLALDDDTTSCIQARRVHFVDAEGVRLRMDLARRAGFGGVALWALGYDDATVWDAIGPLVRPPR